MKDGIKVTKLNNNYLNQIQTYITIKKNMQR